MGLFIGFIIAIICGILVGQDAAKRGMNWSWVGYFCWIHLHNWAPDVFNLEEAIGN